MVNNRNHINTKYTFCIFGIFVRLSKKSFKTKKVNTWECKLVFMANGDWSILKWKEEKILIDLKNIEKTYRDEEKHE